MDAPAVELPPLAPDADETTREVYEGYRLLMSLRAGMDKDPDRGAYAIRFVTAWCRVSFHEASKALTYLRENEIIREVERRGTLRLYAPGRLPRKSAYAPDGDQPTPFQRLVLSSTVRTAGLHPLSSTP